MEFSQLLHERRSIRHFDGRQADPALIRRMLEAAVLAPSWKNSQTARYTVVTSPELLQHIREEALPPFNAANCEGASALIVAGFIKGRSGFDRDGTPANELGDGWGAYDLGLQNENLILQARELGLDTLIMGIRNAERLRRLLKIDPEVVIVSVIAVGYRTQDAEMPARKSVDEIARFL